MRVCVFSSLLGVVSSFQLFQNEANDHRIPTSYESAVMGRRILALTKLATLSTSFPMSSSSSHAGNEYGITENRPSGLEGLPIGLMDYIADCEDQGNPTILAVKIGTTFRNADAGSNVSVSLRWTPPYPPSQRISTISRVLAQLPLFGRAHTVSDEYINVPDTVPYSAANLPRLSLIGYLETIQQADDKTLQYLADCYTSKHRDAKYWLPGNKIHTSEWMRMVVTQVYWVGGFGDRAYIGWIPTEEWKNVTRHEWEQVQLPGEKKGWNEWHFDEAGDLQN